MKPVQRMAAVNPDLSLRLADVEPAVHAVGGSADAASRRHVDRVRRRSAAQYARCQAGVGWSVAGRVVGWTTR